MKAEYVLIYRSDWCPSVLMYEARLLFLKTIFLLLLYLYCSFDFTGRIGALLKDRTSDQRGRRVNESRLKIFSKEMTTPTRRTQPIPHTSPIWITQVCQSHVVTKVLLTLVTTCNENLHSLLYVLHRLDRWPVPVRLVDRARSDRWQQQMHKNVPGSVSDSFRP
jgi:hypothetical protein